MTRQKLLNMCMAMRKSQEAGYLVSTARVTLDELDQYFRPCENILQKIRTKYDNIPDDDAWWEREIGLWIDYFTWNFRFR